MSYLAKLYLYIHQSKLNNRRKSFYEPSASLYGHIGWSFDKKNIYGFQPKIKSQIEKDNIVGLVKNDTKYFDKISEKLIYVALIPIEKYNKYVHYTEKDYNKEFESKYCLIPNLNKIENNCISFIYTVFETCLLSSYTNKLIPLYRIKIKKNETLFIFSIQELYEFLEKDKRTQNIVKERKCCSYLKYLSSFIY